MHLTTWTSNLVVSLKPNTTPQVPIELRGVLYKNTLQSKKNTEKIWWFQFLVVPLHPQSKESNLLQ